MGTLTTFESANESKELVLLGVLTNLAVEQMFKL